MVVERTDPLLQRLVVAAVLGTPVLLLSMVPALQFRNWQWLHRLDRHCTHGMDRHDSHRDHSNRHHNHRAWNWSSYR